MENSHRHVVEEVGPENTVNLLADGRIMWSDMYGQQQPSYLSNGFSQPSLTYPGQSFSEFYDELILLGTRSAPIEIPDSPDRENSSLPQLREIELPSFQTAVDSTANSDGADGCLVIPLQTDFTLEELLGETMVQESAENTYSELGSVPMPGSGDEASHKGPRFCPEYDENYEVTLIDNSRVHSINDCYLV